jgi:hypothetical protein
MDPQAEPDPSPLPAASTPADGISKLATGLWKSAAGLSLFVGVSTTILASAHLEGVIQTAITKGYVYNFRLASLLILGSAMVAGGVLCIAAGRELARGHRIGWQRAFYGSVLLVLVSMPLEPIQPGIAPGITVLGGLNLFALLVVALLVAVRRLAGRLRGIILAEPR